MPSKNKNTASDRPRTTGESGPKEFRIGFLVHDVSRMRRTLFDTAMKPLGITRSQWWALAQLSRSTALNENKDILQSDLARIMEVGKVTVGGLIDRLESSGFVVRVPDAHDRRAKRVSITKQGHEVLDRMVGVGHELNIQTLTGISPEELRTAEGVLAKMKVNIRAILGPDMNG